MIRLGFLLMAAMPCAGFILPLARPTRVRDGPKMAAFWSPSSTPLKAHVPPKSPRFDILPSIITSPKLTTHAMLSLPEHFKSILYLSTDEEQDFAIWPQGMETLKRIAPSLKSFHIPIDTSADLSFKLADQLMATLDRMEGPILITDSTGQRSSAVKAMYAGVTGAMTPEALLNYAEKQALSFADDVRLTEWVLSTMARSERPRPLDMHTLTSSSGTMQTYVVGCPRTGEGVIVDPDRDSLLRAQSEVGGLHLTFSICTRSGVVRSLNAPGAPEVAQLTDGDRLMFGDGRYLEAREVTGPGGVNVCLVSDDHSMAFVGESIASMQGNVMRRPAMDEDEATMWHAMLHNRLLALPKETLLLHRRGPATTVGSVRAHNRFLRLPRKAFVQTMVDLGSHGGMAIT